jgi:hypothetical protein
MKHRWLYAFTALLIGAQGSASAQVWPVKPIRAIVPVSAGSTTDIVARLVLDQLSSSRCFVSQRSRLQVLRACRQKARSRSPLPRPRYPLPNRCLSGAARST